MGVGVAAGIGVFVGVGSAPHAASRRTASNSPVLSARYIAYLVIPQPRGMLIVVDGSVNSILATYLDVNKVLIDACGVGVVTRWWGLGD